MSKPRYLTSDEVEMLIRMNASGAADKDIAIAMGRSHECVGGKRRKLGLAPGVNPAVRLKDDPSVVATIREMHIARVHRDLIAQRLGISVSTMQKIVAHYKITRPRLAPPRDPSAPRACYYRGELASDSSPIVLCGDFTPDRIDWYRRKFGEDRIQIIPRSSGELYPVYINGVPG